MKNKYFILYSNNTFESVAKLDSTQLRLLEKGVISLIYDIEKDQVKGNTKEGIKDIDVPFIE